MDKTEFAGRPDPAIRRLVLKREYSREVPAAPLRLSAVATTETNSAQPRLFLGIPRKRTDEMALIDRRSFLAGSVPWLAAMSSALAAADGGDVAGAEGAPVQLDFGPPQPFDYDAIRQRAQDLAKKSYVAPAAPAAKIVQTIDFDAIQKIKFRSQYALWADGPDRLPVRFFHLDKYVGEPVTIHAVEGGQAREVLYATRYFDYGGTGLAEKLPNNLGFSGFRVMNGHASKVDWLAFQGASYFRSAGAENQYGLSARVEGR